MGTEKVDRALASMRAEAGDAICAGVEQAGEILQGGAASEDEEAIGSRFLEIAVSSRDPRVKRAVAEALFHLRTVEFDEAIRILRGDDWPKVAEMAERTFERRTALSKSDFVTGQDDAQLERWIAELEIKHPGTSEKARRIARRYGNLSVKLARHEMSKVVSPLAYAVDKVRREIARETPDREECERQLETADRRIRLLLGILDRLGTITNAGSSRCHTESLLEILQEAVDLVKDPVPEALRIPIELSDEAESPVQAEVRRGELVQAFRNLIQNAWDAYEGLPHRKEMSITIEEQRDVDIVITIADQGCGMTRELSDELFTTLRFTNKDKDLHEGMGLGVAKALIEAHGGTIAVTGEPDRGAEVRVVIPKRQRGA